MSNNAVILAIVLFTWYAAYCLAAPTLNVTVTPVAEPGWRKEPKGRGTFSIILTSVLTLGLCVWTAIHPNVEPGASAWQKVRRRLLFVVLGMLAPELLLSIAFYEWQDARKFHRKWCELYGVEPGSRQDTLRMKGAFFVTMGGVSMAPAYRVPSNIPNLLSADAYLQLARTNTKGKEFGEEEFKRLMQSTSTAHTAVEAAKTEEAVQLLELDLSQRAAERESLLAAPDGGDQPDRVPGSARGGSGEEKSIKNDGQEWGEESKSQELEMIIKQEFVHYREVQDKGKAEMLGKALVCVQALWMLVQCIARKASGLPVTLLEIHVAMHVVCATAMYGFWFNKPQDVGEPIPIGISSDPEQLCVEIACGARHYQGENIWIVMRGDEYYGNKYDPVHPLSTTRSVSFPGLWRTRLAELRARLYAQTVLRLRVHTPLTPAVDADTDADPACLVVPHGSMLDLGPVRVHNGHKSKRTCVMRSEDLDYLVQAAKAYNAGKRPKLPRVSLLNRAHTGGMGPDESEFVISNTFPGILIILAYGACHAAAWNTHFPSPAECLLWRISSIVIAVIPAYVVFLIALQNGGHKTTFAWCTLYFTQLAEVFSSLRVRRSNILVTSGIIIFVVIPFVLWLLVICLIIFAASAVVFFGRLYLFIESFLSLRSLPYGSFDSTPWEDYFPHF